jgi:hypothetical protein
MRTIHDKSGMKGLSVGTSQNNKGYIYNFKDNVPDPNMRTIHNKSNMTGVSIGTSQNNKGYIYNFKDNVPDPNMRTIHGKNKYLSSVKSTAPEHQRSRLDASNMNLNTNKEIIAKGRAPTLSNTSKGQSLDYTTVRLSEPLLAIDRELFPDSTQYNSDMVPFITRMSHKTLPQTAWTINTHAIENIQGNQYINNIIYKSDYP